MGLNCKIGDIVHAVDVRNTDLQCDNLLGLSMTKEFRPSTSNIVGTDLSKYKIVGFNEFAVDFMSAIRVHKMPIALNRTGKDIIVSPAYGVFAVNDEKTVLPEFLMLWFRRPDFDKYADFKSDSAIRGGYDWNELCETNIVLPPISEQRKIVHDYQVITDRIELLRNTNEKLVEVCNAYYHCVFETHDEYWREKSDWYKPLGNALSRVAMGPFGSNIKTDCFVSAGVPVLNGNNISTYLLVENEFRYVEPQKALELRNSIAHSGDIVITHRGTLGQAALIPDRTKYKEYVISQSQFLLTCDRNILMPEYLLFYFHTDYGKRALLANDNTTGVPSIAKPTTYIKSLCIPIPPMEYQKKWSELINKGLMHISNNNSEIEMMETLKRILLTKII